MVTGGCDEAKGKKGANEGRVSQEMSQQASAHQLALSLLMHVSGSSKKPADDNPKNAKKAESIFIWRFSFASQV